MGHVNKRTFVLVHGGWHGAWCWRRVEALLRSAGYDVYTLSLTGMGDRAHMASPEITLDDHIQDVVSLLEAEELQDVVLVGHSYGGMVISGVADRTPERIRRLVYLNAFVPEDNQSLLDYLLPAVRDLISAEGESTGMVSSLPIPLLGITEPDDIAWLQRRLVKQSYKSIIQPIRLSNPIAQEIPKTFVSHTRSPLPAFEQLLKRISKEPNWQFFELDAAVDAMITDPEALAGVLVQNAD